MSFFFCLFVSLTLKAQISPNLCIKLIVTSGEKKQYVVTKDKST